MRSTFLLWATIAASLSALANAAFPWCSCADYALSSSPFSLALYDTTSVPGRLSATFIVNLRGLSPPRPSTCYNILQDNGVEKIEIASSEPALATRTPNSWHLPYTSMLYLFALSIASVCPSLLQASPA
ncbi:hypothetical protein QJQ45_030427 [Haematococcus lacustris]|nr:hypothetical protein QJQ45_030427 [Haematococcus lacustris]